MLGLGEEIGRDVGGFRARVGEDQDLAGAGEEIDGHRADELALRLDDEAVSRAEDAVNWAYCFRPESHRRDRLRAADFHRLSDAGLFQRVEKSRVDFSIRAAGSRRENFRDTSRLGEARRHQRGGNQRCLAAGDVNADAVEGRETLAHGRAFGVFPGPILAHAFPREGMDVAQAAADGFFGGGRDGGFRIGEFLFAHKKLLFGKLGAIEAMRQLHQRVIAFHGNRGNDVSHQIAHRVLRYRPAPQAVDERFVSLVLVSENLHAAELRRRCTIPRPPPTSNPAQLISPATSALPAPHFGASFSRGAT